MRICLMATALACLTACGAREPLPGPAIPLYTEVPAGDPGSFETYRSRGVMEMYLTRGEPERRITQGDSDVWAVVTLVGVADDGTVTITMSSGDDEEESERDTLSAKPGRAFPGTGIHVIASHAGLGTALLRSRWTHTRAIVPRPPVEEARPLDTLPGFSAVQPLPGGRVYLEGDKSAGPAQGMGIILSARGGPWVEACWAEPGDTVHVGMADVLGAGARWLVYLGEADDGRLMFQEFGWFYDIIPDSEELVAVPAYGELPYSTPQVTEYGDDGPLLVDLLEQIDDELGEKLDTFGSDHRAVDVYASADGTYEIVIAYLFRRSADRTRWVVTKVTRSSATTPPLVDLDHE